jgi:DNA replication protein DnaC
LDVLRWVKQWDFAKDLVLGKPKSDILQRVDEHRKTNSSKVRGIEDNSKGYNGNNSKYPRKPNTPHNAQSHSARSNYEDQFERPERKILLIHGQPGLGKTTLAHVIAQTTGYSVLEINAR